ncbi:Meiotic recombination protein SPO11 [Fasciola hepatica]|uniref:Meiotic recombination protein SPO11 n=1 Tax=Fasciola hepatica TaxID=6192 RepID=A0A4E0RMI1_FASHE|nr:Meiotic recombination protein SPO11 [Fasciola hepatica]
MKIKGSEKLHLYGNLKICGQNKDAQCDTSVEILRYLDGKRDPCKLECDARFVLVIEKYTIYQRIVESNFYEQFKPCLLLTAKGYPDLKTRRLLACIAKGYPEIPIFGLFDADPHGLSIFCTYKFGTKNAAMQDESLKPISVDKMELIGLLATELESLQIKKSELLQLTEADSALLSGLQRRKDIFIDRILVDQINALRISKLKCEIEVLDNLGAKTLFEYLKRKLNAFNFEPEQPASICE